jgi:hypothetical protein
MSVINSFLHDFIKMRKEAQPLANAAGATGAVKKRGTNTKDVGKASPDRLNGGLQRIIDEKPHKREVIDYLQERANGLTVEKMA